MTVQKVDMSKPEDVVINYNKKLQSRIDGTLELLEDYKHLLKGSEIVSATDLLKVLNQIETSLKGK